MYNLQFWIELIWLLITTICILVLLFHLVKWILQKYYYKKEFNNITKRIEDDNISDDDVWKNIELSFNNLPPITRDREMFLNKYIEYLTKQNKIKLAKKISKWILVHRDYVKYKIKNISNRLFRDILKTEEAIKLNNTELAIERLKNLTIAIAEELEQQQQPFSWHKIFKPINALITAAASAVMKSLLS